MINISQIIYRFDRKKILYLIVGGWNTLAGLGIFAGVYFFLSNTIHYLFIATLAHVIAVFQAWFAYRTLVFHSKKPWFVEYFRFNLSALLVLIFQLFGLWVFVDHLKIQPLVSQSILVVLTVVFSYFVHTKFSFDQTVFKEPNG